MALQRADGTPLSKPQFQAQLTDVPVTDAVVGIDVYETYNYAPYDGSTPSLANRYATFQGENRLRFKAGQVVKKTVIDELYPTATVTGVSPATGVAAGGTPVVITGTNLAGTTGVTIGGVAATAVAVLSQNQVRATTGAHAAGAVNVVVADDSGSVTLTNGYTYT